MKTACFLLVAALAALCGALTDREVQLEKIILQAQRNGQLDEILSRMMVQYNNQLPQDFINVLNEHNIPLPTPAAHSAAPVKSKYKFKGMEKLSANELRAVNIFLDEYFVKRDEEIDRFQPPKMSFRVPRKNCRVDDDCPFQQFCFDIAEELLKDMSNKGYAKYYKMVMTGLDIRTKECTPRYADVFVNDVESYMGTLRSAFEKIQLILKKSRKIHGMQKWLDDVEIKLIKPFNFTKFVEEPLATKRQQVVPAGASPYNYGQQPMYQHSYQAPMYYNYPQPQPQAPAPSGGMDDMLFLLLPLVLMGDSTGSQDMMKMLPLLLAFGGGGLGGGDGGLSPLLLVSVLGMGDNKLFDGGNNFMIIILLTTLLGSDTGGVDSYILPFLLIMMQQSTSMDNEMLKILPLILFGTDLGAAKSGNDLYCPPGQGQNSLIQILLFTTLLNITNTGSSNSLSPLFLILLLQPQDGCSSGGGLFGGSSGGIGIMEIVLIQSITKGGDMGNIFTGGNSLLPLLLIMGVGSGGNNGQIDPSLLLITLLPKKEGEENNDMMKSFLPILLLSDPNFAQNPLIFLVLFNDNLFGSSSSSSGTGLDMNMIILLLVFTGMGGQQPISSPWGINQPDPSIPQPGGPPIVQQPSGGGLFGGLGDNGLFTFVILSNILGGGSMGTTELLLFVLISQPGIFGSGSGGGGLFGR